MTEQECGTSLQVSYEVTRHEEAEITSLMKTAPPNLYALSNQVVEPQKVKLKHPVQEIKASPRTDFRIFVQ